MPIVYTLGMKAAINIKADKKVKKEAQKLAEDLGLSLSAVVNASLKEFVRNRSVHFSMLPQMTGGLERLVRQAERDFAAGRAEGPFASAEELIAGLRS